MLNMSTELPSDAWLPVVLPVAVVALCVFPFIWTQAKYPSAPGPFVARFTNLWQAFKYAEGHFEKDNIELHRKHGKIVRLGPKSYSIDDLEATKIIYGHGTQFAKAEWYAAWNADHAILDVNLFAQRNIKKHSIARRRYAHLYAMSSLMGYEPYVNNCIEILSEKLRARAKQGESIDLSTWLQFYAFDVIGEITFSKRFGFMESEHDVDDIIATISSILETSQIFGLFKPLMLIQPLLASIKTKGASAFMAFAYARIAEGKREQLHGSIGAEERAAPDFLSKLLAIADSYDEKGQQQQQNPEVVIAGACLSNLFAGSDTTSISLNAIYFNIVSRPEVLARMRAELDAAHALGELSDPPTFAESQKLVYFQAVLKESLRMHPATGLPIWREVPAGGATLSGKYFPAGTNVGVNSWVAHSNQDVYGQDAAEFRAERWIDSPKEKLKAMNELYMPFGLGSRTCIGKNISLLEISKLIPHLVRKFDMTLVDAESKRAGLPTRNTWFVKQRDFVVNIKVRGE